MSTLTRTVLASPPANVQAQAVSATAINLTWNARSGATGYRVYRNGTLVGSPTTNSYSDSGLAASTSYTYTVSTVAASGEGPQGAGVQGTTLAAPDTTAPTAPVITATATGQSTISVALTTPATDSQSGVASYDLEYKTAAASTYTAIVGLTAGQFPYVIGSLTPATTYNTRARARDGASVPNVGPYSTVSNATTQAAVGGAVSPVLTASRTSGPAPLAVHFSGIGTTASGVSDPFRELGYYFDFHDPTSGTWTHSGQSKNIETGGPLAAHVFETPGTYTVLMSARRSDGSVAQTSATITVQNPDTVYSGTNTVCLSRTTDHTGAPAGAQLISNVSAWPTFASNRRYLLRRGQDFSSLGTLDIPIGVTDTQVGAFGSGARPITSNLYVFQSGSIASAGTYPERITFYDLDCNAELGGRGPYRHCTWLRCSMQGQTTEFAVALGGQYDGASAATQARVYWPEYVTVQECEHRDTGANTALYGGVNGWALLGNLIARSEQHNFRLYQISYGIVSHNRLYGAGSTQHQIKLHSDGDDAPVIGQPIGVQRLAASRWVVVSHNSVGNADANPWAVTLAPENTLVQQGLEDCIVEDNVFQQNFSTEIVLAGRRMTARGNTGTSISHDTSSRAAGLPPGWDGPYYTGEASITTQAPTR